MTRSQMRHSVIRLASFLACAGFIAPVGAEPIVSFTLQSPQAGQDVSAGTSVDWTITVSASSGDNLGLALACCDLVADSGNPAFFDIPPADASSLSPAMSNFDRPDGIANPGEEGAFSGFVGVQRGEPGFRNLIQIGGAQNTAGQALAPGTGCGESAAVVQGIGQGAEPQILAAGSFIAPTTPGTYTFRLVQGWANVLTAVPAPPDPAEVVRAQPNLAGGELSFVVSDGPPPGDLDCSGHVNMADISAFVMALTDPDTYTSTYPCEVTRADLNDDGLENGKDIQAFTDILCALEG